MNAQDIINQAEKEEGRRNELLEIFYPIQHAQTQANRNITKILNQLKVGNK